MLWIFIKLLFSTQYFYLCFYETLGNLDEKLVHLVTV